MACLCPSSSLGRPLDLANQKRSFSAGGAKHMAVGQLVGLGSTLNIASGIGVGLGQNPTTQGTNRRLTSRIRAKQQGVQYTYTIFPADIGKQPYSEIEYSRPVLDVSSSTFLSLTRGGVICRAQPRRDPTPGDAVDVTPGDALVVTPGGDAPSEELEPGKLAYTDANRKNGGLETTTNGKGMETATETDNGGTKLTDGKWQQRWTIVGLCFIAFLLCNMDRVNMSIAILPMQEQYGWSPATVGLVQSSFFWGYLLTQVAGGIWADSIGGKQVLGFGVVWWSIATVMTPIAANLGLPALLFARACMGVGEGVAMPAMNNLLSRWVPVSERSRSLALVYSGMYLGSVLGLSVSPGLIHKFSWPSVFYSFGSLGALWFFVWQRKAASSPSEDPSLSPEERKLIASGMSQGMGGTAEDSTGKEGRTKKVPWKLLLSKAPVWAIIISHFCHNWGTFILLTWMPTYYRDVLHFNLTESGLFSVLPWLTMAISANVGGWIADTLISKGTNITLVRKAMQTVGFLGPAFCLWQLPHISSPPMAVLCMMASQGTDAFSQSGLYSNHQDIGPRYAGVLLGISNTAGVLAGVIGTAVTGQILQTGSWDDVFKVAVGLYLVGTVVWNVFATGERVFD